MCAFNSGGTLMYDLYYCVPGLVGCLLEHVFAPTQSRFPPLESSSGRTVYLHGHVLSHMEIKHGQFVCPDLGSTERRALAAWYHKRSQCQQSLFYGEL